MRRNLCNCQQFLHHSLRQINSFPQACYHWFLSKLCRQWGTLHESSNVEGTVFTVSQSLAILPWRLVYACLVRVHFKRLAPHGQSVNHRALPYLWGWQRCAHRRAQNCCVFILTSINSILHTLLPNLHLTLGQFSQWRAWFVYTHALNKWKADFAHPLYKLNGCRHQQMRCNRFKIL